MTDKTQTQILDKHRCPRVVVLGGGFGGLWAVRTLSRFPVEGLLLDRNNYHTFLPLLYQVVAAELEPEAIVYPVRSILRSAPNFRFVMAEVQEIDMQAQAIKTAEQTIPYDFLILSTGSTSHFLGVPGADKYAFPLKTLKDGIALRNHILRCFERAAQEPDAGRRKQMLTFTILGGGPTGVEFAGALTELIRGPLTRDYPTLNLGQVQLILVEAADNLLASLPGELQGYALARLRKMGVEVRLQSTASQITPEAVHLKDGSRIPTETVVWTAGVRGDPRASEWGLPTGRNGRVIVQPTLQVVDHPTVYVIGDLAYMEQGGAPLPLIAPVAIQQGVAAAQNIARQVAGQSPVPFHYWDRGAMVTIGRNAAVACLGGRTFTGFLAWIVWLGVHILNLIGFRNRLLVLINWAWDYVFYERGVRLILP